MAPSSKKDKIAVLRSQLEQAPVATNDEESDTVSIVSLYRFTSGSDQFALAIGALAAVGSGCSLPLFSFVFGKLVDDLGADDTDEVADKVSDVALLMTYLGIGVLVAASLQMSIFMGTAVKLTARLKAEFFAAILRQEQGWVDTIQAGQLTAKLHGETQVVSAAIGEKMGMVIQHAATIVSAHVVGFVVCWRLTLVLMATTPLIALSGVVMQMAIVGTEAKKHKAYAEAGGVAEEALQAIRTVHAFSAHKALLMKFTEKLTTAAKQGTRGAFFQGGALGFAYFLFFASYSIGFYYASYLVEWEINNVADVVTAFFAVIFGAFSLGALGEPYAKIAEAQVSSKFLYSVIDRVPKVRSGTKTIPTEQFKGHIEFKKAVFAYPAREQKIVFNAFDLDFAPGSSTALVGMSGCGKSSIVSLTQRFYDLLGEVYLWDAADGARRFHSDVSDALVAARKGGSKKGAVDVSLSECGKVRGRLSVDFERSVAVVEGLDGTVAFEQDSGRWLCFPEGGEFGSGVQLPSDVSVILTQARGKGQARAEFDMSIGRWAVDMKALTMRSVEVAVLRYDPGAVTIDGVDICDLDLSWWRKQIGVVTQEPVLFSGTILENVRAGRPEATVEEVQQALEDANILGFVKHCGHGDVLAGLETRVGEGGGQLSGGQKQRIAIARAIIRAPRVLLLDEATSALDRGSEQKVQVALRKAQQGGGRPPTTIVVAHRLVTVQDVDKIVVLRPPRPGAEHLGTGVVEQGKHGDLIRVEGGHYASLWHSQMGGVAQSPARTEPATPSPKAGSRDEDEEPPQLYTPKRDGSAGDSQEPEKKEETDSGMWRVARIAFEIPNATRWLAGGLIGSMFYAATYPSYAYVLSKALKVLTDAQNNDGAIDRDAINLWSVLFLACGAVSLLGMFLQFGCLGGIGSTMTQLLRTRLFKHFLRQDMGFYDLPEHESGTLSAALAGRTQAIHNLFGPAVGSITRTVFTLGFALGISFFYQWELTLVMLATVPLMGLAGFLSMAVMGDGISAEEDTQGKKKAGAAQVSSEAIRNFSSVQAFGLAPRIIDDYRSGVKAESGKKMCRALLAGLSYAFSQFAMFGIFAFAFWYGGKLISRGDADFQEVTMVIMELTMAAMGIGEASALQNTGVNASEAAEEVFKLLDREPDIDQMSSEGRQLESVSAIELREVTFVYPTRPDTLVLRNFSLTVPVPHGDAAKGVQVALIGGTGSGKSTVLQLIQRFYDPVEGSVVLHSAGGQEVDLRDVDLQWWRREMRIVQQEPVLFNDSVRGNVQFGKPGAADTEVRRAAALAQISGDVESWPDQYETQVGARGGMLSGGQKQRVAIARALIGAPSVLLLDEATSALDNRSEKEVQATLDSIQAGQSSGSAEGMRMMATITVAHKLPTIRNCDPICVLQKGKLVEEGSHDQLMDPGQFPGGEYRARYNLYHSLE
eukprot:TRINITY_DN996_c0_g1_i1.p1 TRINITY_DN996_c0_g1~~TRINITY_DN996_c0_g1_i1.p1  ORF type:complete len:1468 (+),score=531.42 TRINITY_DN996_c0_g1_i1:96-4406(+)